MGLFSRNKPKIKIQSTKKDGFSGWIKCSGCEELIHASELGKNLNCCPKCAYHYRLSLEERLSLLADAESAEEFFGDVRSTDPLEFVDTESYRDRLTAAEKKTGRTDAVWAGQCRLDGIPVALAIMDFAFMGGSMGSVVGERLTRLIEWALEVRQPLIVVTASGGARMQESTLSLMQMAKTSAALARFDTAGLPYLAVLTNPTTGGVTASFATLGDLLIAEPDALIAFAGPRVVEQTIQQKLPAGAQKSEFLLERGMIDAIVPRAELKAYLARCLRYLTGNERVADPVYKEGSELAKKVPHRLQELLKLVEVTQ